jgi:hypothetical protein
VPESRRSRALDRVGTAAYRLALIGSLGAFGYLAAHDPFVRELWELAKTASVFGNALLLIMYFSERAERQGANQELFDRTQEYTKAIYTAISAMDRMARSNENARSVLSKVLSTVTELINRRKR